jgi:sulfur-oxidizing protein SoxY
MPSRREALYLSARLATLLSLTGMMPSLALSREGVYRAAFEAHTMAELSRALGVQAPIESREMTLQAPDMAENGSAVPLTASTTGSGFKRLLLLVEKNPNLLAALIELTDAVEPSITTRVKLQQSSRVYAVGLTVDGRCLFAQKEVKVTLGGCAA